LLLQESSSAQLIDASTGMIFDQINTGHPNPYPYAEPRSFTENGKRLALVIRKELGLGTWVREAGSWLRDGGSFIGELRPTKYDDSRVAQDVVEIPEDPSELDCEMFYSKNGSKLFIVIYSRSYPGSDVKIMGWDIKSRQIIRRLIYRDDLLKSSANRLYTHSDEYVTIRSGCWDIVGPTLVFSLNSDSPVQRTPRVFLAAAVRQGVVYLSNQMVSIRNESSSEEKSIQINLENSMAGKLTMSALAIDDQHRKLTIVFDNGKFEFYER